MGKETIYNNLRHSPAFDDPRRKREIGGCDTSELCCSVLALRGLGKICNVLNPRFQP